MLRELALFAGAGGGLLAGRLVDWRTVCAVEIDPYCRNILLRRQREGHLDRFPIWDDVRTFDGRPWRGHVDVVSGGFPCQDISSAGSASKRRGLSGPRSGLWRDFARIVDEIRPPRCFVENSTYLRDRGLVTVLQDLAALGYDAAWDVFGGVDVGAPQRRERLWIVAHAHDENERTIRVDDEMGWTSTTGSVVWPPANCVARVDDGMAHRLDRTRVTGNGQIPSVAALAWRTLSARLSA